MNANVKHITAYRVMRTTVCIQELGVDLSYDINFIIGWTVDETPTVLWMHCGFVGCLNDSDIFVPVLFEQVDKWSEKSLKYLANKVIDHYKSGHYDTTCLWESTVPEMGIWSYRSESPHVTGEA